MIIFIFEFQSNFNSLTKEINYSLSNAGHLLEDKNSRYSDFLNYSAVFFEKYQKNTFKESLINKYQYDPNQKIYILMPDNFNEGIATSEKKLNGTPDEIIISKAISLGHIFKEAKQVFTKSPWMYFTSPNFIYIYPYTPPSNFKFSKNLINLDYFQKSLPKVNPSKKIIWTNPYFDLAGQGMMITKSKPIYINNDFVGTLAIDVKIDELNDGIEFKNFNLGTFYILNSENTIIASSNEEKAPSRDKQLKYPLEGIQVNPNKINFKSNHLIFYTDLINNEFQFIYDVPTFTLFFNLLLKQTFSLILFLFLFIVYLRWYFKDKLTQQKIADNIYKNKLISLAEMSGGIAHEINNPLTIIKGKSTQILKKVLRDEISNEEIKSSFEKIIFSADRIANIVTALKNFSQNEVPTEMSQYPLEEIINEALLLCENKIHSKNVSLEIELIPHLIIYCHKHQIIQLLINLISNSLDAINDKDERWIKIYFSLDKNNLNISIIDSGIGITDGNQNKIFEPFFTTKPLNYGTGLGLSISKKIAINHKGDLKLNTKSPNTCFVVELPFIESSI